MTRKGKCRKIKCSLSVHLCIITHSVYIVAKYVSNRAADETKHIVNAQCTLLAVLDIFAQGLLPCSYIALHLRQSTQVFWNNPKITEVSYSVG